MPIGDPMGGEMYDLGRGRLKRLWMSTIPVKDLEAAVDWYTGALGLDVLFDRSKENWVEMGVAGQDARVVLYVPGPDDERRPGLDTGIIFATDSIFEVHRRLVDEGVIFTVKPERRPWGGLIAVFLDLYDNKLTVIEDAERPKVEAGAQHEAKERPSDVTIRTIVTK